ncbi:hypothetical protein AGMMS49991_09660 [Spirochaetia bacterium]|nr:hypothetical protein AGMMS49991_09660 [Spirochaetia bacterium]
MAAICITFEKPAARQKTRMTAGSIIFIFVYLDKSTISFSMIYITN